MSWSYRVIKVEGGFGIAEVYYRDDGKPWACTDTVKPFGETVAELSDVLRMMADACAARPVFEVPEEWKE